MILFHSFYFSFSEGCFQRNSCRRYSSLFKKKKKLIKKELFLWSVPNSQCAYVTYTLLPNHLVINRVNSDVFLLAICPFYSLVTQALNLVLNKLCTNLTYTTFCIPCIYFAFSIPCTWWCSSDLDDGKNILHTQKPPGCDISNQHCIIKMDNLTDP